ncbi:Hypothetical predicted protein [Mytilus galloprovincialis]|uniref:Peptidase M12A domain-containing protein n=1 Tax=Mytilus galloprovincialis TaxID=29158 RepID=A0A8B6CE04_MYTGA|nr:Hypothetical predicted protein [Mytilus galloprovincialis]
MTVRCCSMSISAEDLPDYNKGDKEDMYRPIAVVIGKKSHSYGNFKRMNEMREEKLEEMKSGYTEQTIEEEEIELEDVEYREKIAEKRGQDPDKIWKSEKLKKFIEKYPNVHSSGKKNKEDEKKNKEDEKKKRKDKKKKKVNEKIDKEGEKNNKGDKINNEGQVINIEGDEINVQRNKMNNEGQVINIEGDEINIQRNKMNDEEHEMNNKEGDKHHMGGAKKRRKRLAIANVERYWPKAIIPYVWTQYYEGMYEQTDIQRTCVHELGHSLGLFHEQRSPFGRDYVRVSYDNINSEGSDFSF